MEQPTVTLTMNHYRELEKKAKAHDDELITIKLTEDWDSETRYVRVGRALSLSKTEVLELINSEIEPKLLAVIQRQADKIKYLQGFRMSHFAGILASSCVTALLIKIFERMA